jgi:hypothetical protein
MEDLTDEQDRAAKQLHGLLQKYADRPFKTTRAVRGARRVLPQLDNERWNQNLLLDGNRGSGKTALLVTLLDLWTATFDEASSIQEEDPSRCLDQKNDREAKRKAWRIDPTRWPIVPVGLLDLQPLPDHTPVLLHIAEHLARVVEAIEDTHGRDSPPPPWHLSEQPIPTSRKAWDELVQAIVAGWDNASAGRWSRLDLEAGVHEIDRAVREHQDIVTRFQNFVDLLIEDFGKLRLGSPSAPPVFVLALDDADMNPQRAGDVIKALRMLHHPRLVFVLTGHSELFYRTAEEDVARDLGEHRERAKEAWDDDPSREFGRRLAHNIYDKVLPPTHRCEITPISAKDRHRYVKELRDLKVEAFDGSGRIPLDLLLQEPGLGAALPEHMRDLKDVALRVQSLLASSGTPGTRPERGPEEALVGVVRRLWERAIREYPTRYYSPTHLRSRVRPFYYDEAVVVAPLHPRPEVRIDSEWSQSPRVKHGTGSTAVRLRGQMVLSGVVRSGAETPEHELPEGLLAALMLADHIAFEHGMARAEETDLSSPAGARPTIAEALYWESDDASPLAFAWLLPDQCTLLDLSLLNFRWWRVVGLRGLGESSGLGEIARWFLTLVAQLMVGPRKTSPLLPATPFNEMSVPPWPEVARRIAELAQRMPQSSRRETSWREWALGQAILIAAPESGLPSADARAFIDELKKVVPAVLWETMRRRARAQRVERARGVVAPSAPQIDVGVLLIGIDYAHVTPEGEDHPWNEFVDPTSTSPEVRSTRFLQALDNARLLPMGRAAKEYEPETQGLAEEERSLLPNLVADLGRWSGARDHEGLAFASLWRRSVRALGREDLENILEEDGVLKIRKLLGRFVPVEEPRSFGTDGDVSSLRFGEAGPYVLMDAAGRDLPPLLQFLYRLAWDKRESKTDDAAYDSPFELQWCGFVTAPALPDGARLPWPCAPWRTFSHFEAFRRSWNELLSNARNSFEPSLKAQIEDELVAAFIYNSAGFQFSEWQFHTAVNFRPNHPNLLKSALDHGASGTSRRAPTTTLLRRNSGRWLRGMATLVSPESAVSRSLARTLRDAIFAMNHSSTYVLSKEDWLTIRDLRRSRVSESAPSLAADPGAYLKSLYRDLPPDDPWRGFLKALRKQEPPPSPP